MVCAAVYPEHKAATVGWCQGTRPSMIRIAKPRKAPAHSRPPPVEPRRLGTHLRSVIGCRLAPRNQYARRSPLHPQRQWKRLSRDASLPTPVCEADYARRSDSARRHRALGRLVAALASRGLFAARSLFTRLGSRSLGLFALVPGIA